MGYMHLQHCDATVSVSFAFTSHSRQIPLWLTLQNTISKSVEISSLSDLSVQINKRLLRLEV